MVIGVAVVLAFTLNYLAIQDRSDVQLVAVADDPLVAGSELSASDVRLIPVDSDFSAFDSLILESTVASFEGWILKHSIEEGQLIALSSLVEPGAPDGLRSMSIPVSVEHAAGGTLSPGDTVDVVSVRDGVAVYVVTAVEVLGVADQDRSGLGALGEYHLVVAVDPDQALAIAEAIDSGSLEVVRSTGALAPSSGEADGS